jgi:hypothetical protein
MSVGQMSVGEMSVGKMSVDQMFLVQETRHLLSLDNDLGAKLKLFQYFFNFSKILFSLKKKKYNNGMEQRALKNVNNYLNTNIYSYLETSGS